MLNKIKLLENIDQNRDFLTILTLIETFENFDQKRFSKNLDQNQHFYMEIVSKTLTKMKIFRLFFLGKS